VNLARKGDGSGFVADSEGDPAEYLALGRVRSVVAGYNSAAVHSMIRKFSGVKPFVLATRRHGCQQCREQEQRCCHVSHAHAFSYSSRFILKVRSQSHWATPP